MRCFVVASVLLIACGRKDDTPPPTPTPVSKTVVATPDAPPPAPEPVAEPVEPAAVDRGGAKVSTAAAIKSLDAMLAEIDAGWRKNKDDIVKPAARPGFRVMDENGIAVILPDVDVPLKDIHVRLLKRSKGVVNSGMKMYADGSLVAVDSAGRKASNEPVVVPLNETLIVFLTPTAKDPKLLARIDVAMP
jgi:hypothetical protein